MLTKNTSLAALGALVTLAALATSLLELNLPRLNLLQGLAASVGSDNSLDEKGQQGEDKHRGDDDHQGDGDGSVSAAYVVLLLRLFLVAPDAEAGHVSGEMIHADSWAWIGSVGSGKTSRWMGGGETGDLS
ncbi:hypothetical protein BGZ61DRAFT_474650 [Ilyonectria robusta]|uniref:uncharacterized protein n=1 Tax=Ilyonectria robusta TaxID=1079257 RepID=UPI001E8D7CF9|nr:uncharacterized protein BGZ61DRAFT_474650 [Ilyonectria robusta]KAH8734028.1 hypothetical protein BGZ61DRAFT_474650 [Ilyonectria robusta]